MRVLKWIVPVDDHYHPCGSGPVIHVALGVQPGAVVYPDAPLAVWTVEPDEDPIEGTYARVYGTGQPIPDGDEPCGSVVNGWFVWHVFRGRR